MQSTPYPDGVCVLYSTRGLTQFWEVVKQLETKPAAILSGYRKYIRSIGQGLNSPARRFDGQHSIPNSVLTVADPDLGRIHRPLIRGTNQTIAKFLHRRLILTVVHRETRLERSR